MKHKWKKRYTAAIIVAVVGAIFTVLTYFATDIYHKDEVALITDAQIKDTLIEKNDVHHEKRVLSFTADDSEVPAATTNFREHQKR